MRSGFMALLTSERHRLVYLWQRQLFTDMPNVPTRQRLEFYEFYNPKIWSAMFSDLHYAPMAWRVTRLQEYLHDGDILLTRLNRRPSGPVEQCIYDGEQLAIQAPLTWSQEVKPVKGVRFPLSLTWSGLVVKERISS